MQSKTGVLLINLGTPDAPTYQAVRRYLKEFLSDSRVIERQGWRWWLILNGMILPKRSKEFSQSYAQIWNTEQNESPLKTITRAQAKKVADLFGDKPGIVVDWAMRYGNPEIGDRINRLVTAGCQHILFFPLYPQYSAATSATAMDKVYAHLSKMRAQPAVRVVPPYFDDPAYIDALKQSILHHTQSLGRTPEATVISFHGLPQAFIDKGDPYKHQCERTAELLREAMGADDSTMPLAYQSSSGRPGWLGPELEDTLTTLARNGKKHLMVVAPGFAADCVETLEEIEIRAAEVFHISGGQNFSMVPCLNDSKHSIRMLHEKITQNLRGWV